MWVDLGDGSLLLGSISGCPESQTRSAASLSCSYFICRTVPDLVGVIGQGKKDDGIIVLKTGRAGVHSAIQGQTHGAQVNNSGLDFSGISF